MKKFIIAALFMLLGTSAYAGPPVSVCDPSSLGNCVKPNSDGSVNISGSVTAGGVTQASTTSGQSGNLTQGAATTSAPTYTNGTTNPLSLDTSGNLRVNVVTGASSGAVSQGSTTSGQTIVPMGCRTLTSAPTDTTAQTNMPWCTTKGSQVVAQPTAADLNVTAAQGGTWTVQPGNTANTTAWKVDGSAVTQPTSHTSGSVASGAYASGSIASGAIASGAVASGAVASGALAAGAGTDGWDVTQGTKSDVPCASGSTTPCSAEARLAHIENLAAASTPAGSAIIGKVGIDQTTDGTTNAVHLVAGTAIAGKVGIDQTTPGTTNAVQAISGTTGGTTPFTLTAANSTNATNIKASAGTLYHVGVYNNSATPAWVSFYNTAGTPSCGTSIVYQTMIPANSTSGAGAVEDFATGMAFGTGIGICITTGIAGTGSVAATSYVVGLGYK